jgi:ribosomal protein L29
MAKKNSLQDKNVAQLKEHLAKMREELRSLRFSAAGARPKDSAAPKKTRAEVARVLTELHARGVEAPEEATVAS